MIAFLESWAEGTWQMLVESALFFLLGLILAGVIWLVLNEKNVRRIVGENKYQAVFRAALVGVPLPLCSCSVLPVARQLRESGVGKGGTVSFLIATPESSVDSILLTYSLTDPLLTVARPIAAFLTAVVAGVAESSFEDSTISRRAIPVSQPVAACCDSCCAAEPPAATSGGAFAKLTAGLRHSFTTLIGDLAPYLLMGYLLAGLVAALLGPHMDRLPVALTSGWAAYVGAAVVGVPLYVCATSSTPLAAVLLASGFPPGAILVFLMVGPATNIAALTVLKKILGLAASLRYLASIVIVSVACGLALDWLYKALKVTPSYALGGENGHAGWFSIAGAVVLSALILWHTIAPRLKKA